MFRGGCLKFSTERWAQLGANQFILNTIANYRLPFRSKPPLTYPGQNFLKCIATKVSLEMTRVIQDLKMQGILEKPAVVDPGFFSKMFLIKKADGGLRPIFDLKALNRYIATKHFYLISQLDIVTFLQANDWLVKIDLHQAYFHLCVAETHRRFLRVVYNGEILQLTALPFGLSSAPRVFAAVSNWVAEILRNRGIRLLVYLDDFLLACQDRSKLMAQVAETLAVLESLGWHVNYQKSVTEPTHRLEYLGLVWDTQYLTIALPIRKVEGIKASLTKLLKRDNCSLRELQSVLGKLNFANYAIPQGRLHCRKAQLFLRKFSRRNQKRNLSSGVREDFRWWLEAVEGCPNPLLKKEVTHFLTTDAADAGWEQV
ncbi:uncharacterized protein LOC135118658 [Helicoverpa armigera]|uniref:uncharacterized protein LOC135118658 n=1 Tax=Helicoverpa armigera TaxID=29058 RepID=UPI003082FF3A